jgi:hypothetical protein
LLWGGGVIFLANVKTHLSLDIRQNFCLNKIEILFNYFTQNTQNIDFLEQSNNQIIEIIKISAGKKKRKTKTKHCKNN